MKRTTTKEYKQYSPCQCGGTQPDNCPCKGTGMLLVGITTETMIEEGLDSIQEAEVVDIEPEYDLLEEG
jgi:hypothetical protein